MRSLAFAVVVGLAACASKSETERLGTATSAQFFENATRRDPTALEASRVIRLKGGCAAYFLENTAEAVYLATAQHCFPNDDIEEWCKGRGSVLGALTDAEGNEGICLRVVAADARHDIAIFEGTVWHLSLGTTSLRLAAYVPAENTRLTMIGYPGDADPETARRGSITTTEDCWVYGTPFANPKAKGETGEDRIHDISLRHNCTVYGGNSGGPMIVEGTQDVIGQPLSYRPNQYERFGPSETRDAAYLGLMAEFVQIHRAEIDAAGIIVTETSPRSQPLVPAPAPPPALATTFQAPPNWLTPRTPPSAPPEEEDGCNASGGASGASWLGVVALVWLARRRQGRTKSPATRG